VSYNDYVEVIFWNINGLSSLRNQARLLNELKWDVAILIEVTRESYIELSNNISFKSSELSLNISNTPNEKKRNLGCAIFIRKSEKFNFSLIDSLPLPERSIVASSKKRKLDYVGIHIPPGISWKEIKPKTYIQLEKWLRKNSRKVILGMDANAPKFDNPDLEKSVWHWDEEEVILGKNVKHSLVDSYRSYLSKHPNKLKKISRLRPDGPLEVSYMRGYAGRVMPCRYDFILVDKSFDIEKVEYLYQESIASGSDHSLVKANLK